MSKKLLQIHVEIMTIFLICLHIPNVKGNKSVYMLCLFVLWLFLCVCAHMHNIKEGDGKLMGALILSLSG